MFSENRKIGDEEHGFHCTIASLIFFQVLPAGKASEHKSANGGAFRIIFSGREARQQRDRHKSITSAAERCRTALMLYVELRNEWIPFSFHLRLPNNHRRSVLDAFWTFQRQTNESLVETPCALTRRPSTKMRLWQTSERSNFVSSS